MWVSDDVDNWIYAYSMTTKQRLPSSTSSADLENAGNDFAQGIFSDGEIMWVTDQQDHWIYAYDMPSGIAPFGLSETLSAGNGYSCAVTAGRNVACWGRDERGQSSPPAGSFVSVSTDLFHTCGVSTDGTALCWGTDEAGQSTPPLGESFASVSVGSRHTCGLKTDGRIECWGAGNLGLTAAPSGRFVSVKSDGTYACGLRTDGYVDCWGYDVGHETSPPPERFSSISVGRSHICGVRPYGTNVVGNVECWGSDVAGASSPPEGFFVAVSAGGSRTCGVRTDTSVECWGLGRNPRLLTPTGPFGSLSAAHSHTCGVRTDGAIECWGEDGDGRSSPPLGAFVAVETGYKHTCGLKTDRTVECWGSNNHGQSSPPAGSFISLSLGFDFSCGIKTDHTVACWGRDYVASSPPGGTFESISTGWTHSCGLKTNGNVECWGGDDLGQSSPPAGNFSSVSVGPLFGCALSTAGSVQCWGDNDDGESSPLAGSFVSISAAGSHVCGVRSDKSVECWGSDSFGQSSPPSDSFTSVASGFSHTCGLRHDGSVDCWGFIVESATTRRARGFASVSVGNGITCYLRTDGNVECHDPLSDDLMLRTPNGTKVALPELPELPSQLPSPGPEQTQLIQPPPREVPLNDDNSAPVAVTGTDTIVVVINSVLNFFGLPTIYVDQSEFSESEPATVLTRASKTAALGEPTSSLAPAPPAPAHYPADTYLARIIEPPSVAPRAPGFANFDHIWPQGPTETTARITLEIPDELRERKPVNATTRETFELTTKDRTPPAQEAHIRSVVPKIYVYDLDDFSYRPDLSFDLPSEFAGENHLWTDGTTLWIANVHAGKIFAFTLSTGRRDVTKDFDTLADAGNDDISGIWSNGTTMWVGDAVDNRIYAYSMHDMSRDPNNDFTDLRHVTEPSAIWSDGTTMWVGNAGDVILYAFQMSDKSRDETKDIDLGYSPASVWSDHKTMFTTRYEAIGFDHELLRHRVSSVTAPTTVERAREQDIRRRELTRSQLIRRIEPEITEVRIRAGDEVRLAIEVYGRQNIRDDSLADDWPIDWFATNGAGSFEEVKDGNSNGQPDDIVVAYTAPDVPGRYTITAYASGCLDQQPDETEEDAEARCSATFSIRVLRASTVAPAVDVSEPRNPTGQIPMVIPGADGTQHAVFTPIEGGTVTSEICGFEAPRGAVHDSEYIGVAVETITDAQRRVEIDDPRFLIHDTQCRVSAVDHAGTTITDYQLRVAGDICIPMPDAFRSNVFDARMIAVDANGDVQILSSWVRINQPDAPLKLCGKSSRIPLIAAAAVPANLAQQLYTPTPIPGPRDEITTPETGPYNLPPQVVWISLLLLGTGIVTVTTVIIARYPRSRMRR